MVMRGLVLTGLVAGCQPVLELEGDVTIPEAARALYSTEAPGSVRIHGEFAPMGGTLELDVLCDPEEGDLVIPFELQAVDCAQPHPVTVWIQPLDEPATLQDCVGSRFFPFLDGISDADIPTGAPQATGMVWTGVEPSSCNSESDRLQLRLEVP